MFTLERCQVVHADDRKAIFSHCAHTSIVSTEGSLPLIFSIGIHLHDFPERRTHTLHIPRSSKKGKEKKMCSSSFLLRHPQSCWLACVGLPGPACPASCHLPFEQTAGASRRSRSVCMCVDRLALLYFRAMERKGKIGIIFRESESGSRKRKGEENSSSIQCFFTDEKAG